MLNFIKHFFKSKADDRLELGATVTKQYLAQILKPGNQYFLLESYYLRKDNLHLKRIIRNFKEALANLSGTRFFDFHDVYNNVTYTLMYDRRTQFYRITDIKKPPSLRIFIQQPFIDIRMMSVLLHDEEFDALYEDTNTIKVDVTIEDILDEKVYFRNQKGTFDIHFRFLPLIGVFEVFKTRRHNVK